MPASWEAVCVAQPVKQPVIMTGQMGQTGYMLSTFVHKRPPKQSVHCYTPEVMPLQPAARYLS